MTRKLLLLAVGLVLLFGLSLLGGAVLGKLMVTRRGSQTPTPRGSQTPTPEPVTQQEAPEEQVPMYGLPLEITVDGVPVVPEEILGPSPPIEEKQQ